METNTMVVIVAIIFAVVIIIGFVIYRRKANVDVELPGSKLKFEGGNNPATSEAKTRNRSNGIFKNLSIGKTRLKVKGSGTIEGNTSLGDTELTKEDVSPINQKDRKSKKV